MEATAEAKHEHAHGHTPLPERERLKPEHTKLVVPLIVVGVIALIASVIGGFNNPKQFAFSYLFSFTYFYTLAVGSFFWVVLHYAVDADWSAIVRRVWENVTTVFPLLAIAFIPLLPFFLGTYLWPWMNMFSTGDPNAYYHGHAIKDDVLLPQKQPYLGEWFTYTRLVLYFGFFIFVAMMIRGLSTRQDLDGNPIYTVNLRWRAPLCLIGFGVAITFSAIDWLMALDFHWFSTMWGVYIFAGSAQSSMALAIVIVFILKCFGYLNVLNGEHAHIMGKLLLAFTVFWAYIAFSQYMLIWYANIPEETIFFMKRNKDFWNTLCIILVAGHFVVPFVVLLFQYSKKSFTLLFPVACWVLFFQGVDLYWIIMPNIDYTGTHWSWMTLTTFIALGCFFAAVIIRSTAKVCLFPARDPRIINCLKLTN